MTVILMLRMISNVAGKCILEFLLNLCDWLLYLWLCMTELLPSHISFRIA